MLCKRQVPRVELMSPLGSRLAMARPLIGAPRLTVRKGARLLLGTTNKSKWSLALMKLLGKHIATETTCDF